MQNNTCPYHNYRARDSFGADTSNAKLAPLSFKSKGSTHDSGVQPVIGHRPRGGPRTAWMVNTETMQFYGKVGCRTTRHLSIPLRSQY